MRSNQIYQRALGKLQEVSRRVQSGDPFYHQFIDAQDQVLAQYQPMFSQEYIPNLTKEEFHSFLLFKNNRHWTGLHRLGSRICENMEKLRQALLLLLDESVPIERRLTEAVDMVPGMGRAVATGILLITHPQKYGVWNNTSEGGLKAVDLWPSFERGKTLGERYSQINAILTQLAEDLGTDLWTLDMFWYELLSQEVGEKPELEEETAAEEAQRFGLERHLHDFLRDNWNQTELGKAWTLEIEDGDIQSGYEYPTGIGKIDLLARDRSGNDLLVIELKRNQTSDETVGQVLRYMGWVQEHMLEPGAAVHGLIIAHEADERIRYALKRAGDVDLKLYQVEFHLLDPPELLTE
jgi:hypothetical protein